MHFVNPYHFVPVNEKIPECIDVGKTLSAETLGHRTFDRYHENKLSGRIVCTLETMGPTIIGSDQIKAKSNKDYNRVNRFLRGNQAAIPGSTLRGCISSIAEAASNSALRVLDNSPYSRRTSMFDDVSVRGRVADYSAMGMIYKEDNNYFLIPLAMPTLECGPNGNYQLPEKYRKLFSEVQLKAYCYSKQTIENAPITYNNKQPLFFYAKLKGKYSMDKQFRITGSGGKEKRLNGGRSILLGYEMYGEPVDQPPEHEKEDYTRGILRVIYTQNRKEEMPTSKKHEIFLPFPDNYRIIPIDKTALETFNHLAKGRDTENKRRIKSDGGDPLPFALKGAQEFKDRTEPYQLQAGDIVFFEPDETGSKIIKVRVSQLWREEIRSRPHDFFNSELLPFHQGRTKITPAEALFGFVEVNGKGEEIKDDARALASRIRFGEGRFVSCPETEVFHDEIPLRILASPKPPCPSFYFRNKNLPQNLSESVSPHECYISKKDLNHNSHMPQGRKFYFNHDIINDIVEEARSKIIEEAISKKDENNPKKNKVRPLNKGCRFVFHVDFENLSTWELGLLLFSLNPGDNFYHKIGMGKPLGFGSIQIRPAGVFFINRSKRYTSEGFADARGLQPRYHQTWVDPKIIEHIRDYLGEHEKAAIKGQHIGNDEELAPEKLKSEFARDMAEPIRKALFKIGRPNVKDIRPPLAEIWDKDQKTFKIQDVEQETFKWFQNNDNSKAEKQGLVPLEYGGDDDIVKLKENRET